MHQTTVRFGSELWGDLQTASAQAGVSVAQFVREAAVARLALTRPADPPAEAEAEHLDAGLAAAAAAAAAAASRAHAKDALLDSGAVWAQGRLARERAQELRDVAIRFREELHREQKRR